MIAAAVQPEQVVTAEQEFGRRATAIYDGVVECFGLEHINAGEGVLARVLKSAVEDGLEPEGPWHAAHIDERLIRHAAPRRFRRSGAEAS
jgi:hypothetical protein